MDFTEATKVFLQAKESKGISSYTLKNYACWLRVFGKGLAEVPEDALSIERFLSTRGPAPETRWTYWAVLQAFYTVLDRHQLITTNPMSLIERPRVPRKRARSFTSEEVFAIVTYPYSRKALKALIFLLLDTGIRLGETLSIREPGRLKKNTIVVVGKTGEREVPINPTIQRLVIEALPWPWNNSKSAGRAVRRVFHKMGIKGRRASAHSLRHTFTREYRGDLGLLQGLMGWSSLKMLKVYRPYDLSKAIKEHKRHSIFLHSKAFQTTMF